MFLFGCSSSIKKPLTLHNYPMLNNECPSLIERSIDDEKELRQKAELANMRYVDYLHFLANQPKDNYRTLGVK